MAAEILSPAERHALETLAATHDERAFRVFARLVHPELHKGKPFVEQDLHLRIFAFLWKAYTVPGFRGCINIMPRAGKTYLVCLWIAWCFGMHSDARFLYATYGKELSDKSSILIKRIMNSATYLRIFPNTKIDPQINSREAFATTDSGEMNSRGIDGVFTGTGAGHLEDDEDMKRPYVFMGACIADDLLKVQDARSDAENLSVKNFFMDTWDSRRNSPRVPMIFIGQRTGTTDIFAWLNPPPDSGLEKITGDNYEVLKITVLDDNGQSIWEAKYPTDKMLGDRKAKPWMFATQFMQEPYSEEGVIFHVDDMPVIGTRPSGHAIRVRGWDLASRTLKKGKTEPDFTAKAILAYYPEHRHFVIEDFALFRSSTHGVRAEMKRVADRDGKAVTIRLWQDPGQAGVAQVQDLTAHLAGYTVVSETAQVDKVTGAEPFASQCNVGNVSILAHIADAVKSHLKPFPAGRHDDGVDALAAAFKHLAIPDEEALARIRAAQAYEGIVKYRLADPNDPTSRVRVDEGETGRPEGYEEGEEVI